MYGGYPDMVQMPHPGQYMGMGNQSSLQHRLDSEMQALISELKSLVSAASVDDLKDINSDESKIINLIEDSKQLQSIKSRRAELEAEIKDLAAMNLSLKPEIQLKRDKLSEVSRRQYVLKEEYDKLQGQARSLSSSYSLEDIQARMKISVSEMDEETENLAQDMLNKDIDFDDFLDKYVPKRAIYHARRTKSEKMDEIVSKSAAPGYYSSGYGRY